jgi:hypothetical protein
MTRSLNYQKRKHPVIKLATVKSHRAVNEKLQLIKSKPDQQVSASGTPKKSPVLYNGQTNHPPNYFHFYLDEVVQSANANTVESVAKRQPISPTAFLGTGFVAATVVSGLLMGDALQPTAPLTTKILPLKPKQRAAFLVPRPTSATPEKLADSRVVSRSHRESQPQATLPAIAVPYDVSRQPSNPTTPQSLAPMLPSVMLAAVPETLPVSRSTTPKHTVTGAPAPAGMKPLVRPAYQDLPELQRPPQTPLTALNVPPAAILETMPTEIAAPERIDSERSPAPIPTPPNPAQPTATVTKPLPLPPAQLNAESSPATPPPEKTEQTDPQPSLADPAIPAIEPPS